MINKIYFGDNLEILKNLSDNSIPLIYIDPPFNSQKVQSRTQLKTTKDPNGDRIGFLGTSYKTEEIGTKKYSDSFDDYEGFIRPRIEEAYRILAPNGSLYFHIDYREVHYCKIWLDQIFGRDSFMNEIIWAYDYGAKSKSKWPAKHDNILLYVKDPKNYTFNVEDIDREPYMAPGLCGPEKAARGKLPTDTWWWTIVGTNSKERNGYPTQKPLGIINRIIRASSNPDEIVMDFFAGSGTVGESCLNLGRKFILIDNNPQAIEVMQKRFEGNPNVEWII
jgi:site-specific DNA-methyltransferase (adenine-specific)